MNRIAVAATLVALAASFLLRVAVASGAHRAAVFTAPSRLDVQLSDVQRVYGKDYRFLLGRSVPNRQITSASIITGLGGPSDALRGRYTGYIVEYVRKNGTTLKKGKLSVLPGLGSLAGAVNAYRNRTGPTLVIRDTLRYHITSEGGLSYKVSRLSGVGDAAVLHRFTSVQPHGIPTAYGAIIIFRRGNYVASLEFSSYKTMSLNAAIRLARIVDNRIKRAH